VGFTYYNKGGPQCQLFRWSADGKKGALAWM